MEYQQPELTLEQQFSIRSFANQVEKMSREQAQYFLISLYEQMLVKESYYKSLLRYEWNLEPKPEY